MTRIMLSLLLLQSSLVAVQSSSAAFEVASVKPAPTNQYIPPRIDPQRFHMTTTLADAILFGGWIVEGDLFTVHHVGQ